MNRHPRSTVPSRLIVALSLAALCLLAGCRGSWDVGGRGRWGGGGGGGHWGGRCR